MEAIIAKLIETLNSSVFTLLVLLVVAFLATYKLGGIVKTFGVFKDENDGIKKEIGGMKDSLAKINATTDLLYQAHLSTVQSRSPLSLTSKGESISAAIRAPMKVDTHWSSIKLLVDQKSPNNPYDIQTVSMDIAKQCFEKIFSADEQNEIKSYAYKIGVNLLEIYPILGVLIRDRILKERGLTPAEVDKHDPAKS